MGSHTEAADQSATSAAETAVAHVRDQAEALRSSLASAQPLTKAKKKAQKVQKKAAKRGQKLSEEAAARSKRTAKQLKKDAKKRGEAALASAPVVAAAARKKGSEALLSALETEPGKRLAATSPGSALKAKLTARKRRRRRFVLITIAGAGSAIAFKQLRSSQDESPTTDSYGSGPIAAPPGANAPATETPASAEAGTAHGDPLAGLVEDVVENGPQVQGETDPKAAPTESTTPAAPEAAAKAAGEDGAVRPKSESS